MFRGSSFHSVDSKGRLIIPTRFRDTIKAGGAEGVVMTNMDNAISAYTHDEWREVEARVLAAKSANIRSFKRFFLGNASECNCDRQGRILIPANLRQYAGIEKDIVLVGLVDHFEIWSRERWDAENKKVEEALQTEELRDELIDLGL